MAIIIKWQQCEIDYLKKYYKKFTTREIQEQLENYFWNYRSLGSIKVKAHRLGLSND